LPETDENQRLVRMQKQVKRGAMQKCPMALEDKTGKV
jgi:hypothetical protein